MAKGKDFIEFNFRPFMEALEMFDENLEDEVVEVVRMGAKNARRELRDQVSKGQHYYSGKLLSSLQEESEIEVDHYGGNITATVGFKKGQGGSVAYYLENGTPKIPRYRIISKAAKSARTKGAIKYQLIKAYDKAKERSFK